MGVVQRFDFGACRHQAQAQEGKEKAGEARKARGEEMTKGNEEMENYRMALAYISKQSTDQQSRELAETALNAFPADRVPQSPAGTPHPKSVAAFGWWLGERDPAGELNFLQALEEYGKHLAASDSRPVRQETETQ
jgi:hypothetical protein